MSEERRSLSLSVSAWEWRACTEERVVVTICTCRPGPSFSFLANSSHPAIAVAWKEPVAHPAFITSIASLISPGPAIVGFKASN